MVAAVEVEEVVEEVEEVVLTVKMMAPKRYRHVRDVCPRSARRRRSNRYRRAVLFSYSHQQTGKFFWVFFLCVCVGWIVNLFAWSTSRLESPTGAICIHCTGV